MEERIMSKRILYFSVVSMFAVAAFSSPAVASSEITKLNIETITVNFTLYAFDIVIPETFEPHLDFPMGEYTNPIVDDPEFLVYTTGDYGAPPPSGTVDAAAETIDLDLSSLRLALDYSDTLQGLPYRFHGNIPLWGTPMSIESHSYNSTTKEFFLVWSGTRDVYCELSGIPYTFNCPFSIELSGTALQSPIAYAGPDQMVFDEIMLDASQSNDPDGSIGSYAWQIDRRGATSGDMTAHGQAINLSNLEPGFYDVVLEVTDDDGLTNTDAMEFSAIGQKGDLNLDGDIDGLDLGEFSDVYGR